MEPQPPAPPPPHMRAESPGSPLVPLDPSRFREMVEKQKAAQQTPISSPSAPAPQYRFPPQHPPQSVAGMGERHWSSGSGPGSVVSSPGVADGSLMRGQSPAYSHMATTSPAAARNPMTPGGSIPPASPHPQQQQQPGRSPGGICSPHMPPPSPYARPASSNQPSPATPGPQHPPQSQQMVMQQQPMSMQQGYPPQHSQAQAQAQQMQQQMQQHPQQYPGYPPQHMQPQQQQPQQWAQQPHPSQAPMSPTYVQQMGRGQAVPQRMPQHPSGMPGMGPPQRYGYPQPMLSPPGARYPAPGYATHGYPQQQQPPTSPQYPPQAYTYGYPQTQPRQAPPQAAQMRYAVAQPYPQPQMQMPAGMRPQYPPQYAHHPQQFSPTYSAQQPLHPQQRLPPQQPAGYAIPQQRPQQQHPAYAQQHHSQQAPPQPTPEMIPRPQPLQFYGHEPSASVPSELCLLGCVFVLGEWEGAVEGRGDLTEIRLSILEKGGEVEAASGPRVTHVMAESLRHPLMSQAVKEGKRCVTARWLADVLALKPGPRLLPPWKAAHFPSNLPHPKPLVNKLITVTGFDAMERECLKGMISAVGAKATAYLCKNNNFIVAKSRNGEKVEAGMNWKIPIVNVTWLSELSLGYVGALHNTTHPKYIHFPSTPTHDPFALDPAYFDRGGNQLLASLMAAWRVPVAVSEAHWAAANERKEKLDRDEGGRPIPHKRIKLSPPPEDAELAERKAGKSEPLVKVLLSGFYPQDADNLAKKVEWLGGSVVTEASGALVVVTPDLKRSAHLLEAVARARLVLAPAWVRQSYAHGSFLDPIDFIVKDEGNEKYFGFNLRLSLCLAKEKPLFKNLLFYLTPSVGPDPAVLKTLVTAAGGKLFNERPTGHQLAEFYQRGVQVVIVTCDTDLHLCHSYMEAGVVVHSAELIMSGILRQELDLLHYRLPQQHQIKPSVA